MLLVILSACHRTFGGTGCSTRSPAWNGSSAGRTLTQSILHYRYQKHTERLRRAARQDGTIPMIRLLLVDDQAAVRRGLRMRLALEADFLIAGEAEDGVSALALMAELRT